MLSTLRSRSGARLARGFASKEIFHGAEARARMLAGANKLADAVARDMLLRPTRRGAMLSCCSV